jgi:hypothetical protein
MPIVTGLFSGLDLRQGEPPHVTVQTRPYETSQTARQRIAVILAILLAVSAMLLASYRRCAPRGRLSVARAMRAAWRARDPTDGVVVGVLLVWWIVAPTFFDDGWVWTEHQAFDDVGAMDFYFDVWGSPLPLGYWIEWLRNWVLGPTSELVYLRLQALVALAACWFLCRWCLGRVVLGPRLRFTRWMLAGGFLVGAVAWGMTLRLEPFLALLTLVVLAVALSFAQTPRLAPLAIAVSAAALAVNVHPAGLVACAPLLAVVPEAGRWLRASGRWTLVALGVVVVCAPAISVVAFTLDADIGIRLTEARASRTNDPFASAWWQEYVRYERFDQNGGGNAVRHLSLGLLLLTVLAWANRRRNTETNVLLVPARSIALALALLAFVPSKWPWHFGALLGIGAVALAAEATRLAREPVGGGRSSIRPVVALAGVVAVALWSWGAAAEWSRVDLQVMEWTQVFGFGGYPWQLAALTVAAVVTPVVIVLRRRSGLLPSASASALGVVAIASFASVGLTCAVLALDAARSSWSPARQNLEALVGSGDCGLADELDGSGARLLPLVSGQAPVLLDPEVALYFPCATIPRIEGGLLEIPRLVVVPPYRWLLEDKDAPFSALPDLYELKRVAAGTGGIDVLSVTDDLDFVRVDAVHRRATE